MSRELKYRMLSKHHFSGKMRWLYFDIQDLLMAPWVVGHLTDVLPHDWENNETLGERTSLVDIAGEEIYEGDIIRWSYGDGDTFEAKVEFGEWKCEGDLDMDRRHLGFDMVFSDGGKTDISEHDYEVIGNIHENPDLLSE